VDFSVCLEILLFEDFFFVHNREMDLDTSYLAVFFAALEEVGLVVDAWA